MDTSGSHTGKPISVKQRLYLAKCQIFLRNKLEKGVRAEKVANDDFLNTFLFRFSNECIDIGSVTGRLEVLSRLARATAGADRVI